MLGPENEPGQEEAEALSDAAIAAMSLDEVLAAIHKLDDGFGEWTADPQRLMIRRDALQLVGNGDGINSHAYATLVQAWLAPHHSLVPDLIALVGARAGQLSAAVAVPAAQQRDEVWAAITAHFQVPASAGAQDCENRAHAICELINAQFPGLARRHLTKIWLIAPNPTLHPPQNWKHHVAPVLACQDGDYAFDLFLSPGAPLTMAAWLTAAQGTRAAGDAGLWHGQRVWDLFGRPDPQIDPGTLDTGAFVDRRPAASNIQ